MEPLKKNLDVTVVKDGEPFLNGTFDVSAKDYEAVLKLMPEVNMNHEQAAALLAGYMHARDISAVSKDMGKLAMFAAVYFLAAGETAINIPFVTGADAG